MGREGRFHVSSDGKVRKCEAQSVESCTAKGLGSEKAEHFANEDQAREYVEKVLERENERFTTLSSEINIEKLRETALNAETKEEVRLVLSQGDSQALKNLVFSPALDREEIIELNGRLGDEVSLRNLAAHENYPIELLSEEEFRKINPIRVKDEFKRYPPTEEVVKRVIAQHGYGYAMPALFNDENLSDETFKKLVKENLEIIPMEELRKHPRFKRLIKN